MYVLVIIFNGFCLNAVAGSHMVMEHMQCGHYLLLQCFSSYWYSCLSYSVLFIVNKIAKYKQMAFYAFIRMLGMVVG